MNKTLLTGIDINSLLLEQSWDIIESEFKVFTKFFSLMCLATSGLPIMPIFIFSDWNDCVKRNLEVFILKHGLEVVQIRSQGRNNVVGGKAFYNLPVPQIQKASKELIFHGALVIGVQAPGDIYRNEYSAHIDIDLETNEINLDVIGPGFTATHLSKWGLLHEQFCLKGEQMIPVRKYLIEKANYRRTVGYLLEKYQMSELVSHQSLLLDHLCEYQPLPVNKYIYIKKNIQKMRDAIMYLKLKSKRGIISASWIQEADNSKPYFWDVHEFSSR